MFWPFTKTKRKVAASAEIASGLVAVQLALGGTDIITVFKAKDYFALGYVLGAYDGACQATGIPHDSEAELRVFAIGYQSLAESQAQEILEWSFSAQQNELFHNGAGFGGQQVIEFLRDKKNPLGLAKHLNSQAYVT